MLRSAVPRRLCPRERLLSATSTAARRRCARCSKQIEPQADDTIVMLGDCVDRGPDSRGVIDELLALRERCQLVPLLGNHEEMMLNFLDGRPQPDNWLLCGGQATWIRIAMPTASRSVPPEHVDFIRTWGDYWETDTHFFVHGSYIPISRSAASAGNVWRWHSLRDVDSRAARLGQDRRGRPHVAKDRRDSRRRPSHLHRHLLLGRRLADRLGARDRPDLAGRSARPGAGASTWKPVQRAFSVGKKPATRSPGCACDITGMSGPFRCRLRGSVIA